jgi:hypothetical protein
MPARSNSFSRHALLAYVGPTEKSIVLLLEVLSCVMVDSDCRGPSSIPKLKGRVRVSRGYHVMTFLNRDFSPMP